MWNVISHSAEAGRVRGPVLSGVHSGRVLVQGIEVTYYDSDPEAAGTPVLLLHGTSGSAHSSFATLHPMLAMRRRVITLDFVDPASASAATSEHYLVQVEAVIAAVAAPAPMDVAGYSFGAVIAAQLAARRASLVRRLVLIAGWARTDAQQLLRNDIWMALARLDPRTLGDFAVLTAHTPRFLNTLTQAELEGLRKRTAEDILTRAVKMQFNRTVDIAEELELIDAETLVIGCTNDQMAPLHHSQFLFGAIRTACYAELIAGHGVVHERPAEVFTVMSQFLDDTQPTKPGTILERIHV